MNVTYDSRNRVVRWVSPTDTLNLTYSGWNLIEDRNGGGELVQTYVHGAGTDEMLVKISSSGPAYYHHDGLGSTVALTGENGELLESYRYDAFGAVSVMNASGLSLQVSAFQNRFLFTGREYLASVGLYDYRNRVYSASLGRFLQTDPIRFEAGDVNLYRYCGNNPGNLTDPLGLWTVGGRFNVSGPVFDVSFNVTVDGHGNVDLTTSRGPGATAGLSATLGVTTTDADCVDMLHGWSNSAGFSGGEALVIENNVVWGDGYVGGDFGLGLGAGSPITPQGARTHTHSFNH